MTLIFLQKNGWTIRKQCRPWSDAAFCGVLSGSALFASYPFRGLQFSMGKTAGHEYIYIDSPVCSNFRLNMNTVDSRYLDLAYLE